MTIKKLCFVFSLLIVQFSTAQEFKEKEWKKHLALEGKKDSIAMLLALNNKDYQTAASLSYQMLVDDEKNIGKLYQLARIYYAAEKYELSINTCGQVLNVDSVHLSSLTMAASCFIKLKQIPNALKAYERLYQISKDPNYLYQIALVQFENKQLDECLKVLSVIVSDTSSASRMIELSSVNDAGENVKQSIPLNAAAYNIVGFIYSEKLDYSAARKYYAEALKIAPNFTLAKNNLTNVVLKESQSTSEKK